MRAGLLTEQITIENNTTNKDDFGSTVKVWQPVIKTRCNIKFNSGNRQIENKEIINSYSLTFTLRFYHNITEDMRIVWNRKRYRILSIFPDKHKQSIEIIGSLINE